MQYGLPTIRTTILCFVFLAGPLFGRDDRPVADVFREKLAGMLSENADAAKNAQQEWQRYCLRLGAPGREAQRGEAVRLMAEALPKTEKPNVLKWLVRQLGYIGDASCVEAIGKCFEHKNSTVMEIAAWSLGTIPNNEAGRVLEKYLEIEKRDFWKKGIRNALDFRKARQAVTQPKLDEVLKTLEGDDPAAWDAALPSIGWLHDVKIADVPDYEKRFNQLAPGAKRLLLDALSDVRDRSALPLAVTLVRSNDASLKQAGLRALGPIGDASVVPLLLSHIKEPGEPGETARDSLRRLNFEKADETLIAAFSKQSDDEVRTRLIDILCRRRGAIAIPLFEQSLADKAYSVQLRAAAALGEIGEPASVAAMLDRFFQADIFTDAKKELRETLERSIVRIGERDRRGGGDGSLLCDAIFQRNEKEQARIFLFIGSMGGTALRDRLYAILADETKDGEFKTAALRALNQWPDASVADQLHEIGARTDDPLAPAAIRAYVRIVTLRSDRSAKDSLALFDKAMKLAKTAEDRRLLLTRVETARSMEVFRFVVPYLDDPELEQAACRAVVDLANDNPFYMRHRKEIDPALDKVIEKSKDKNHVDRAKRYKDRR